MAKRRGYQDSVQYAGALLRWVYSGHLRPRDNFGTEGGGGEYGANSKNIKASLCVNWKAPLSESWTEALYLFYSVISQNSFLQAG